MLGARRALIISNMADQRNFRSAYLEKVGIKGVEEKKSLEILLSDHPLDLTKLQQFCLRFPVPAGYREFLWKVLLGILPPYQSTHAFVSQQRREQYQDLQEALTAMRRIDENSPLPEVFLKMHLIEQGTLPFDEQKMFLDQSTQVFIAVATVMGEVNCESDEVDTYWLTTKLYKHLDKFRDVIPTMKEKVEHYLRKEDTDGKFVAHLTELRAFQQLPLIFWFRSGFASVLPENAITRIWDKVIGGSCKVLVYVAVAILLTLRRPILSMDNMEDVLKYISQIPSDSSEIIVSKAIEIWQKHGCPLMPISHKSDSPSISERAPS